jgi:hypothetical protein
VGQEGFRLGAVGGARRMARAVPPRWQESLPDRALQGVCRQSTRRAAGLSADLRYDASRQVIPPAAAPLIVVFPPVGDLLERECLPDAGSDSVTRLAIHNTVGRRQ